MSNYSEFQKVSTKYNTTVQQCRTSVIVMETDINIKTCQLKIIT